MDCATPCRPPDAKRATRDDSGWKTADPKPINEPATNSQVKLGAAESSNRPSRVNTIPIGREYGSGLRSVNCPIKGWKTDAVIWKVSVSKPTWPKFK